MPKEQLIRVTRTEIIRYTGHPGTPEIVHQESVPPGKIAQRLVASYLASLEGRTPHPDPVLQDPELLRRLGRATASWIAGSTEGYADLDPKFLHYMIEYLATK